MFLQWLHEEAIRTSFEAAVPEAALAELVAMLPSWGMTPRHKSELLNGLLESGKAASHVHGEVLIFSAVTKDVAFPLASFGISRKGVAYGKADNQTFSCLLLAVLPEAEDVASQQTHLEHDAELFFNDPFFRQRLKISESPAEAYEVLLRQAQHLDLLAHPTARERLISVS